MIQVPYRDVIVEALRFADAEVTGDIDAFILEVGVACADAFEVVAAPFVDNVRSTDMRTAKNDAAKMRAMANTLDVQRLQDGGMNPLKHIQLATLLEEAAAALDGLYPRISAHF
jgi:hypothetical protein